MVADRLSEKTLILQGHRWTRRVAELLGRIEDRRDGFDAMAFYRQSVEDGRADVLAVWLGRKMIGAMVMRIDDTARGREAVIVAAAGECPGVDFLATVLPMIEQLSAVDNCATIRFHTRRPGLAKRTVLVGYEFREIVMSKRLAR